MSPILVRPVREQLEHDRVIRLLQAKYKRKFEVGINPGNEHAAPVGTPPSVWYPDLVLMSQERSRKLLGVVEVETGESVNNLEAMSQWATFARLRAAFHLYVPVSNIDTARRLCQDLQISVAEFWAYHSIGDQIRFTLVQRSAAPIDGKAAAVPKAAAHAPATEPARPAPEPSAVAAAAQPRTPARARTTRVVARPSRRTAATKSTRRAATPKPKAAAARRAPKPAARKAPASSSRAQKRR